jgi:hypothetical protein
MSDKRFYIMTKGPNDSDFQVQTHKATGAPMDFTSEEKAIQWANIGRSVRPDVQHRVVSRQLGGYNQVDEPAPVAKKPAAPAKATVAPAAPAKAAPKKSKPTKQDTSKAVAAAKKPAGKRTIRA